MKRNNAKIGRMGERMAEQYLLDHAFDIVERRFRIARGEIDLIATKDEQIVFVEVKTRNSGQFGSAGEAVTKKKQQTMAIVAQQYLIERNLLDAHVRFDVIEVYPRENRISHITNAFYTSEY